MIFTILHILMGIMAILIAVIMIISPIVLGGLYFLQYGIQKIHYFCMANVDIETLFAALGIIEGFCFIGLIMASVLSWTFS